MKRNGKKTLIASIVALSLTLTGIGYAYWTDTLNVTTKATTGDLDVTFVDLGLYAQYDNETIPNGWSIVDGIPNGWVDDMFFARGTADYNKIAKDGTIAAYDTRAEGYNNIEFNAKLTDNAALVRDVGPYTIASTTGSDNIELSVQNLYPGYAQAFRSDIINQGTIAAKLSNIAFDVSNLDGSKLTAETKGMLGIALLVDVDNSPNNVFKLCTAFADNDNYFRVGGVDFLRLSALEGLSDTEIQAVIENAEIKCYADGRSRMDLIIGVAMDPDAKGTYTSGSTKDINYKAKAVNDEKSQNDGATISIDFAWDQFNEGVDEGNGNILNKQNK